MNICFFSPFYKLEKITLFSKTRYFKNHAFFTLCEKFTHFSHTLEKIPLFFSKLRFFRTLEKFTLFSPKMTSLEKITHFSHFVRKSRFFSKIRYFKITVFSHFWRNHGFFTLLEKSRFFHTL